MSLAERSALSYSPLVQEADKERALTALRQGQTVEHIEKTLGVSRRALRLLLDRDPLFRFEWNLAVEDGADFYENLLREQAQEGNIQAIITGLKIKGRLRDDKKVEHVLDDRRVHTLTDADLEGRLAELEAERQQRTAIPAEFTREDE